MNTNFPPDGTDPTGQFEAGQLDAGQFAAGSLTDDVRSRQRRTRRNQALVGVGAGVAFVALVIGCLPRPAAQPAASAATTTSTSSTAETASTTSPSPTTEPTDDAPLADEQEDENSSGDDSHGFGDDQAPLPPEPADDADDGMDIPPLPQPDGQAEPQPCDLLAADGSSLVVWPDPVVLDSNDTTGELQLMNCSDGDVDWTASVNPKVTLDNGGANVLPGESATVGFSIDFDAYGDGAIDFKIKVSEPGHNHYVDVHAYNPLLGTESVAGNDTLTAGDGVGGCSQQCIVSALLRPNLQTPNVALDVTTNTPATIRVWVSQQPPVIDDEGVSFGDADPIDTSGAGATTWTAQLQPLDPTTKYYIIVSATDGDGDVSFRHGSFYTLTPVDLPGDFGQGGGESGCSTQCIVSAVLTPGDDIDSRQLDVTTHTPVLLQASVSAEEPEYHDGVPSFDETVAWANSGLQYTEYTDAEPWTTMLDGLSPDTEYHIIVKAEDGQGRTAYRVGTFQMPAAPTVDVDVTLLGIHVDNDGDSIGRGEMSFGWSVGDTVVATIGERKVDDGDWVTFPADASYWPLYDQSGVLPLITVNAVERDADGLAEFCSMGVFVTDQAGSNGDCDVKWNGGSSGIYFVDQLGSLPSCTDFGADAAWADHGCMVLESAPNGDDYPSITALVAIRVH